MRCRVWNRRMLKRSYVHLTVWLIKPMGVRSLTRSRVGPLGTGALDREPELASLDVELG